MHTALEMGERDYSRAGEGALGIRRRQEVSRSFLTRTHHTVVVVVGALHDLYVCDDVGISRTEHIHALTVRKKSKTSRMIPVIC